MQTAPATTVTPSQNVWQPANTAPAAAPAATAPAAAPVETAPAPAPPADPNAYFPSRLRDMHTSRI
jgi:hypothetical protein